MKYSNNDRNKRYAVKFEKHVSKFVMTYGQYDTFEDAAKALKYLKSVNTIDYCFIDELYFKSEHTKQLEKLERESK